MKRISLALMTSMFIFLLLLSGCRTSRRLAYHILSYVLKNKGIGGTAWNISKNVYDSDYPRLEEAKAQALEGNMAELVSKFSKRISRRIIDLNRYLEILNVELKADRLYEYKLSRTVYYCLIEKS